MPTLNQRLGSFPTESRVAIFPQCRQDSPLPPPINRSEFHSLREKKIRSKVCHLLSVFLSLTLHRPNSKPRPPPISPASFPPQATARPPHVKSVTTVAAASAMWAATTLAAKLSINAATSLTSSSMLARHKRHARWSAPFPLLLLLLLFLLYAEFHYFEQWNMNYNSRPLFQWTLGRTNSGPRPNVWSGPSPCI